MRQSLQILLAISGRLLRHPAWSGVGALATIAGTIYVFVPRDSLKIAKDDEVQLPTKPVVESGDIESYEVARFVQDFIRISQNGDIQEVLKFYSIKVNYFGNTAVDRNFIETDINSYRKKWSGREFKLVKINTIKQLEDKVLNVVFCYEYNVKSEAKEARGTGVNSMKLHRTDQGFQISDINEVVLPDGRGI